MTVYTPIKKQQVTRVVNSDYIMTENKPDDGDQPKAPETPANPGQPEAK